LCFLSILFFKKISYHHFANLLTLHLGYNVYLEVLLKYWWKCASYF